MVVPPSSLPPATLSGPLSPPHLHQSVTGPGSSGSPAPGHAPAPAPVLGSFRMKDCGFKVQASKRATGRVVCWMDLAIPNSYTLEASFCGMGDNAVVDARWV